MTEQANNNLQKLKDFINNNLSDIYNNLSEVYDSDRRELTTGDFLGSWVTRDSLRDYVLSGRNGNEYIPSEFDIERASDVLFDGGVIIFADTSFDNSELNAYYPSEFYPSTFVYLQDGDIKYYNDVCGLSSAMWDIWGENSPVLHVDEFERKLFLLSLLDKGEDVTRAYNYMTKSAAMFHKFYATNSKISYVDIRSTGLTYDEFLESNEQLTEN